MNLPHFHFEAALWDQSLAHVAGVDEVGRGALAGPVVAASVVFPHHLKPAVIKGLNDSKLLTPTQRFRFSKLIHQQALYSTVAVVSVSIINRLGIAKATFMAMRHCLQKLPHCQHLLVDGYRIPRLKNFSHRQTPLVKGDRTSLSIAAASVLAKIHRDQIMKQLHLHHPQFAWDQNKGYGTHTHRQALTQYGPTPHHRPLFLRKILYQKPAGYV